MAVKIQLRRGTALQWSTANPILADGEFGFEKDTRAFKIGDGVTNWNSLTYTSGPSKFRGAYDASTNLLPGAGLGSGPAGAIQAGDEWSFSDAGTINGDLWPVGTIAKALVNTPGQTAANWRLY